MAKRILVQMGHVNPREPGFESGTGTTGEIELATKIGKALNARLLKDPRFTPILVPGDIPNNIRVDAALFLHGDGSSSATASGFSFGFPAGYSVNARLARLIGQEFLKIPGHPPHRTDNYTAGLRAYYGYRLVQTDGPEVLVEHGFLTNPRERHWLFTHTDELAEAEYVALCRYFNYVPLGEDPQRLEKLRAYILSAVRIGWSWAKVKRTDEWAEFRRLGGK